MVTMATTQLALGVLETLQAELPSGSVLTFSSLFQFMALALLLRNDILLTQAASHPTNIAPDFISPAIKLFLAACCDLCEGDIVDVYWKALKDVVWYSNGEIFGIKDTVPLFANHGQQHGITHTATHGCECATIACSNDALAKSKLQQCLQHSQLAYPTDSIVQDFPLGDLVDDTPLEEDYLLNIDTDGCMQATVAPDLGKTTSTDVAPD
ncbi:hypothetical protein BDR06DRAFT_1051780 [Suillus hirtellus]|nr:hypothetical protein BDR06DRAFT_1051780 [Suillus hirtellus]